MNNPFAKQIVAQIDNPKISGMAFRQLLVEFTASLKDCVKREAVDSLRTLAPLVANRNVSRASWVAEVCQAMVESGCDSFELVRPLARGLKRSLKAALPLAAKLERKLAPKLVDIEDPQKISRWTDSAIRQLSIKMPEAAANLKTLQRFCHAAETVYGLQVESRRKAFRYLGDFMQPLLRWSQPVRDLHVLLNVLEKEPFVVIDPANRKGFIGKFGGAIDNNQFLILLMDTYAKQMVFGRPLVSFDVAQCAKGIGPCHVPDEVHGAWNVYTFQALTDMQKLPDPKDLKANKHWIWNGRTPDEIPQLDGYRVILIGPPSYPRTWHFTRRFKHLAAGIVVDHELEKLDIQAWLDRIRQVNYPQLASHAHS